MKKEVLFFLFLNLLFLLLCPTSAYNQSHSQFSASQVESYSYGIEDGLPDICISHAQIDSKGQLHLITCTSNYASSALYVYKFDGKQAYPSEFKINMDPIFLQFETAIAPDLLYGYYIWKTEKRDTNFAIFKFDLITGLTECFPLNEELIVLKVVFYEESLFTCVYNTFTKRIEILHLQEGKFIPLVEFPSSKPDIAFGKVNLAVNEKDFWVALSTEEIYRINKKDGAKRKYLLPVFNRNNLSVSQMLSSKEKHLFFNTGEIYLWEEEKDSFTKNPFLPTEWIGNKLEAVMLSKDGKGNILVGYQNAKKEYHSTLFTNQQKAIYYPLSNILHSISQNGYIRYLSSNDFNKGLMTYYPGLHFINFSPYDASQNTTLLNRNRGMVQLDQNSLYTTRHGIILNQDGHWVSTGEDLFVKHRKYFDGDVKKDANGNIWTYEKGNCFLRYQPTHNIKDSFCLETASPRFDFFKDSLIVYAAENHVYLMNPAEGKSKGLTKQPFESNINQVFVGSNDIIWVAGGKGLLKVDVKNDKTEWIHLGNHKRTAVMRIHEDRNGRLWLGTIIQGILIYDPINGKIKSINQSNGLSNNMVVSLLEDDDGNIWAGTYHGITKLSPDGVVLGKLFEKDGLAGNECNRWSALKLEDGRLCFGSNSGISFIDPAQLKQKIEVGGTPKIYLTQVFQESQGKELTKIDLFSTFLKDKPIVLPAKNRNLKVAFALSNYIAPHKNNFAYKIEGHDNDWNYIGNQRQLALTALPVGTYKILVKGADGWGRWSKPLEIHLSVNQFWYNRWWAYLIFGLIVLFIIDLFRKNKLKRLQDEAEKSRLMEMDTLKTKLYTNITHEFRTPLTVISGMAEQLEKSPSKAKELIQRNSKGLLKLVNQILDLAKLDSGHLKLENIQADIIPYIKYLCESFQSLAAKKNIRLLFQTDVEQLIMDFDEKKLESILSNLLSNAIKFTNENGLIEFSLKKDDSTLLLKVSDDGIGIPPDKLPHIFERFYQVTDSSSYKAGGTGIGLTLIKELVELMSGSIKAQSPGQSGKGTEFLVSLSISNRAPVLKPGFSFSELATSSNNNEDAISQEVPITGKIDLPLLLLIEDNPDIVTYIKTCLESKYIIEWAENGAKGIERAIEITPDVIISDVMMPEKDGFEVCKTLKNDERTSHIPIILLTAKVDAASRLEGLGLGADAYLAKPFLKEELIIRLEKLIELRRKLQQYFGIQLQQPVGGKPESGIATQTIAIENSFIKKVRELMEAHLDDADFGVEQLAREIAMSSSQVRRKMAALTGLSPNRYFRSLRLGFAKELLKDPELSISEVAYQSGFADPSYFARVFVKEFGLSPKVFREKT